MAYLFDPEVLTEIVRMHLGMPVDQQIDGVTETLKGVYGAHLHTDQPWTWSNTGGLMCCVRALHLSPRECVLLSGTAIGSEGHSGRHRADLYQFVMAGELWTFEAGSSERKVHGPGDIALLRRGRANATKLRPGLWMLTYARGNIASIASFAVADTLFSTLDLQDLRTRVSVSARLLRKEVWLRLEERLQHRPFAPNLKAIGEGIPRAVRSLRRNKGRPLTN